MVGGTGTQAAAAPTAAELAERAAGLFPVLREHARRADDERHLTREMVDAYAAAELVPIVVPERFGGYGLGFNAIVDVTIELGRASGSMGWVGCFWADHAQWIGLYPEQAQVDVWGDGPHARVATSFAPLGRIERTAGGYLLSGNWPWASGVAYSDWVMLGAPIPDGDGRPINHLLLVPVAEITVEDTWYNAGLRGSGSDNVVANSVFVPEHRLVSMLDIREGSAPGAAVNRSPVFQMPLMTHAGYGMLAPAIGVARGVIDEWGETARSKAHTYTKEQLAGSLPMQMRLAESAALVDAAELILRRCLDAVERGEATTLEHRVRHRRDISFAMTLVTRAVDDLIQMAGAGALRDESPIQRGWRDVRAIACHVMLNFNAAAENYGRFALELPLNPRDPFF
jgi:3-hydroxy-9,10-secoandrosta-1,3,5(10)-triene-9,17-dione monooxygenase